jgi:hypothetical protein
MTWVIDLFRYGVELNWRLMWFPVHSTASLKDVRVRASSFHLPGSDVPLPQAPKALYDLGKGNGDGAPIIRDFPVFAQVEIGTGSSYIEADIEIRLGTAHTRTTITVEPGVRTPFMLTLPEPPMASSLEGFSETVAVVDGVFNAGARIKLIDLMRRLGP